MRITLLAFCLLYFLLLTFTSTHAGLLRRSSEGRRSSLLSRILEGSPKNRQEETSHGFDLFNRKRRSKPKKSLLRRLKDKAKKSMIKRLIKLKWYEVLPTLPIIPVFFYFLSNDVLIELHSRVHLLRKLWQSLRKITFLVLTYLK